MKKIALIILVLVAGLSTLFAETSTLDIKTTINQANILSFTDSSNQALSEVNFSSSNSVNVKAALWTNKAVGNGERLPQVTLVAKPMVHETVKNSFIAYTLNGVTVNENETEIDADLFKNADLTNVTQAKTYYETLNIELNADSKTNALVGNYSGSIVVTIAAN